MPIAQELNSEVGIWFYFIILIYIIYINNLKLFFLYFFCIFKNFVNLINIKFLFILLKKIFYLNILYFILNWELMITAFFFY